MILAKYDQAFVQRNIRERRSVQQTQVFLFVIARAFAQRLPLEIQCGVDEDSPADEFLHQPIEFGGFHPLIQRTVLVTRLEMHVLDGVSGGRTCRAGAGDAFHVLDAADSPAN